jgi:transaldolase
MKPIEQLHLLGQSIWYDNIERKLLDNGEFVGMINRGEIRGVTSNPSIFNNAIANSGDYDDALVTLAQRGLSKQEIYEHLAVQDIKAACDLFLPLYDKSNGADGYVSLEVSPYLANDSVGTYDEAMRLWTWVDRPNLMIKIPATMAGLSAIEQSIASGINVNVTLIFSIERYKEVMNSYIAGLEQRIKDGNPIHQISSVASFFVSRIDTFVDAKLNEIDDPQSLALRGRIAVANAKMAYAVHSQVFSNKRWGELERRGGRIQRALWASTSTKDPSYSDTKYVDELIGPNTVNTLPPATLVAFQDHGTVSLTLTSNLDDALAAMNQLVELGISIEEVTSELETQGVKSFSDAFTDLLETVEIRRNAVA